IAESGKTGRNVLGGITAKDLLAQITHTVIAQQALSLRILDAIQQELQKENIFIIDETQITEIQKDFLSDYVMRYVSSALMTGVIGELDKLPDLRDSVAYLAITMENSSKNPDKPVKHDYALNEIPATKDRLVVLPAEGDNTFVIM